MTTLSYRDLRGLPIGLVRDAIGAENAVSALLRVAARIGAGSATWTDEAASYASASTRTALLVEEAEKRGATVTLARIARSPRSPDRWLLVVEADAPARAG